MPTTDINHLYITIASMTAIWITMCYPLIYKIYGSWYISIFAFLFWIIALPITMFATKSYEVSLDNDDELFVIIKIVSVVAFIVILHIMLTYLYKYKKVDNFWINIILYLIFAANIAEAVGTQMKNSFDDDTGDNKDKYINLFNSIIGIFLIIWLLLDFIKGKRMQLSANSNQMKLMCNFNIFFILAYTFWNILFRSQLFKNTSVLLFFGLSLVLPILTHITGYGDWLQVRAYTLLALMILTWGIGEGEARIFPQYNDDGYDKEEDEESIWTKVLGMDWYRYGMLVLGFVFFVVSVYYLWVNNKSQKIRFYTQ